MGQGESAHYPSNSTCDEHCEIIEERIQKFVPRNSHYIKDIISLRDNTSELPSTTLDTIIDEESKQGIDISIPSILPDELEKSRMSLIEDSSIRDDISLPVKEEVNEDWTEKDTESVRECEMGMSKADIKPSLTLLNSLPSLITKSEPLRIEPSTTCAVSSPILSILDLKLMENPLSVTNEVRSEDGYCNEMNRRCLKRKSDDFDSMAAPSKMKNHSESSLNSPSFPLRSSAGTNALSFSIYNDLRIELVKEYFRRFGTVLYVYHVKQQYSVYFSTQAEREAAIQSESHSIGCILIHCTRGDYASKNVNGEQSSMQKDVEGIIPKSMISAFHGNTRFFHQGVVIVPHFVSICCIPMVGRVGMDSQIIEDLVKSHNGTLKVNELSTSSDAAVIFPSGRQADSFLRSWESHPKLSSIPAAVPGKIFLRLNNCKMPGNTLVDALERVLSMLIVNFDEAKDFGFVRFHSWKDAYKVLSMKKVVVSPTGESVGFFPLRMNNAPLSVDWPYRMKGHTMRNHVVTQCILAEAPPLPIDPVVTLEEKNDQESLQNGNDSTFVPSTNDANKHTDAAATKPSATQGEESTVTGGSCFLTVNFIPHSFMLNKESTEELKRLGVNKVQLLTGSHYGEHTHAKLYVPSGKAISLLETSPLTILGHKFVVDIPYAIALQMAGDVTFRDIAEVTGNSYGPIFDSNEKPNKAVILKFHCIQDARALLKAGGLMVKGYWLIAGELKKNVTFPPFKKWIEKNKDRLNNLTSVERMSENEEEKDSSRVKEGEKERDVKRNEEKGKQCKEEKKEKGERKEENRRKSNYDHDVESTSKCARISKEDTNEKKLNKEEENRSRLKSEKSNESDRCLKEGKKEKNNRSTRDKRKEEEKRKEKRKEEEEGNHSREKERKEDDRKRSEKRKEEEMGNTQKEKGKEKPTEIDLHTEMIPSDSVVTMNTTIPPPRIMENPFVTRMDSTVAGESTVDEDERKRLEREEMERKKLESSELEVVELAIGPIPLDFTMQWLTDYLKKWDGRMIGTFPKPPFTTVTYAIVQIADLFQRSIFLATRPHVVAGLKMTTGMTGRCVVVAPGGEVTQNDVWEYFSCNVGKVVSIHEEMDDIVVMNKFTLTFMHHAHARYALEKRQFEVKEVPTGIYAIKKGRRT